MEFIFSYAHDFVLIYDMFNLNFEVLPKYFFLLNILIIQDIVLVELL